MLPIGLGNGLQMLRRLGPQWYLPSTDGSPQREAARPR
jgi:hypothetical protein